MAAIMAKDNLTPNDMEDVHQLTYTLEVALAKLIEESTELAQRLEYVQEASEGDNGARLRDYGLTYLETAQKIVLTTACGGVRCKPRASLCRRGRPTGRSPRPRPPRP